QFNIAAGAGLRYQLNPSFTARLEFVHRILTTDYLDDVSNEKYIDPLLFNTYLSPNRAAIAQQLADRRNELPPSEISTPNDQRGDPKDNDAFFTIQLKISMTLGRQRR
ncbi:MAG: hypothetical protein ABL876_15445, partial [Chitinophagaceae bacterium]